MTRHIPVPVYGGGLPQRLRQEPLHCPGQKVRLCGLENHPWICRRSAVSDCLLYGSRDRRKHGGTALHPWRSGCSGSYHVHAGEDLPDGRVCGHLPAHECHLEEQKLDVHSPVSVRWDASLHDDPHDDAPGRGTDARFHVSGRGSNFRHSHRRWKQLGAAKNKSGIPYFKTAPCPWSLSTTTFRCSP